MKELAADESLSEEARDSAKKALEVLVSSQLHDIEQAAALKKLESEALFVDQQARIEALAEANKVEADALGTAKKVEAEALGKAKTAEATAMLKAAEIKEMEAEAQAEVKKMETEVQTKRTKAAAQQLLQETLQETGELELLGAAYETLQGDLDELGVEPMGDLNQLWVGPRGAWRRSSRRSRPPRRSRRCGHRLLDSQ